MVNKNGHLTSHTKITESALGSVTLNREPQDMITPVLNLDTDLSVEILTRAEHEEITHGDITCVTDSSRLDENRTRAGVVIKYNITTTTEESVHIFLSFYLSITDVVDSFSMLVILRYINATGRINTTIK